VKSRIGKVLVHEGEEYVTCEEVITFLLDYISKELTAEEEREFERHLALCPSCVAYLRTYREAVRLGREAYAEESGEKPPELGAELTRAILRLRS
jgi:anti-sigma factor RsiW